MAELHVDYSVFCLTIAFCTIVYFQSLLRNPVKFAKRSAQWRNLNPYRRIGRWIYTLAAWFGFGFMIRAGFIAAFSWVPGSWFRVGDLGWLPTVIAMLTTILVVDRFNAIGKSMAVEKEQPEASLAGAE